MLNLNRLKKGMDILKECSLPRFESIDTIPFDQAIRILREHPPHRQVEGCSPASALGKVLAIAVESECDLPLFNNSAVDGFAICEEDRLALAKRSLDLALGGTIYAGFRGELPMLRPGMTIHVLTGAPVPHGTAAIVMQEDAKAKDGLIEVSGALSPRRNIRFRGEECLAGAWLFDAGTCITPAVIGALSAVGCSEVQVYKMPKIGLLITGSELVAPGEDREPFQIFDANGPGLIAALHGFGVEEVRHVQVSDEQGRLADAISNLSAECDVLITVGGISVGDRDLLRPALADEGFETLIQGVAMRPGKPFYFGCRGQKVAFGLPGNRLSAMVAFLVLVQPYLRRAFGIKTECQNWATLRMPVASKLGIRHFVPGFLDDGRFDPSNRRSSSMLSGLGQANALAVLPEETEEATIGEEVEVIPITWQARPL